MMKCLDRHSDWAVLIALIGSGQEIHDGEAGIAEWIRAYSDGFSHWDIHMAQHCLKLDPQLVSAIGDLSSSSLSYCEDLNLGISMRSHRAVTYTEWVDHVLGNRPEIAAEAIERSQSFPIVLTRDLSKARDWLRRSTIGTRRYGLLASSGAARLRPYGIEVSSGFRKEVDYPTWFTAPKSDLRSSYALEVPASEFECQGLELDRVGLCWGGDLVRDDHNWRFRQFRGSKWVDIRAVTERMFLVNKYRVLLTRAREGVVIWVPTGDEYDTQGAGPIATPPLSTYYRAGCNQWTEVTCCRCTA
jgi:hypothetical protein